MEVAWEVRSAQPLESSLPTDERDDDRDSKRLDARLSEWMRAAQRGDAEAYRDLLNAIQPKIRAIVRAKIHQEAAAEDVVQNTLLSIHRGRSTYRPERPFGPWMRAIARNSIIDHFRDRKRRGDREVELIAEQWADDRQTDEMGGDSLAPELEAALASLPDAQREAVTLVQVRGLSVAEAALRAGVSVAALKVRAHRGYRAMRLALEGKRKGGEWPSARPAHAIEKTTSRGAG